MYCDNQITMYITNNPVFHKRTEHTEVHCHFIRDMVMTHRIITSFVILSYQLEKIFTKVLFRKNFNLV